MPSLLFILVLAGGLDEGKAVSEFKRAFAPARVTSESRKAKTAAIARLRPFDSERVARVLIDAYVVLEREAEPLVEKRRPLLEQGGGKKVLRFRLSLTPIRKYQQDIRKQLLGLRAPDSVKAQVRRLMRRRGDIPHTLKRTLAAAAGRLAKDDLGLAIKTPGKGKERTLGLHLEVIRNLGRAGQPAGPWVLRMLDHKSPVLREMAAATLESLQWPESLRPLAKRLAEDDVNRVRTACARTLERLTGLRLGTSKTAWTRWLDAEGGPWETGKRNLGGHTSEVTGDASGGYYFGIPQDGRSILYVYDASHSMRAKFKPGKKNKADTRLRVDVARDELVKALGSLKPTQRFNIIGFANKLERYDRAMGLATKANVKRAQQWVKDLPLRFGTNTNDALELAFNTAGRGSYDRYYPLQADTVFLLSDGAPTVQKMKGGGVGPDKPAEIRAAVRRWNPFGRIVVHTIGIGLGKGRVGFMKGLATDNGGKFVQPQ